MSMAIPGVFRPTFVDAVVDIKKLTRDEEVDLEYLKDYMGFFVDGGTTNNFPLHAFDDVAHEGSTRLNDAVLGVRCTGGVDKGFLKDYKATDDLFAAYERLKPKGKRNAGEEVKIRYGEGVPTLVYTYKSHKPFAIFGEFIGSLYDSVMYYTEAGQVLSPEEEEQIIELFSYEVGLFDFDLSKEKYLKCLSLFVQRTAAVKLACKLGIFDLEQGTYKKIEARYPASAVREKPRNSLSAPQRVALMLHDHYDISKAP